VSHGTVHRISRAHALKPHQVSTFKFTTDPEAETKIHHVVGLYLNPPPELSVRGARGSQRACHQRLQRAAAVGYSITWSARRSSDGGTVRPSAFAVLRLMTRRKRLGCSIGSSPAFAPLKILST
jgi:hypothetical protein